MDDDDRTAQAAVARDKQTELAARGVRLVALTWVDISGITRVKAVPLAKLEHAARWGVGASPVFDSFLFNDIAITGRHAPGVLGDLRLHPDLDRLTVLAAQPGWAWAPADRYDQDGRPFPLDQRTLARVATDRLAAAGFTALVAFEVEWTISPAGDPPDAEFRPAVIGPAYGYARVVGQSEYVRDVAVALAEQGVSVDQIHPEYAPGQFEVSVGAGDPVSAADTAVLVRETIRAVSHKHGFRVSFAPKVVAGGVGNGGHVHLSIWQGERNVFAGGTGPFGLTEHAEAFTAGILHRLPALLAVGAPSVGSYLRLVPQHWAGAFASWGLENREAAVRLVTGVIGNRDRAANVEVKCFDQSANPYLAVAGLVFAGLAGVAGAERLPEPVDVDPGALAADERERREIRPLPRSLADATDAFAADQALRADFGEALSSTIVDVRRAETAHFDGATEEEVVAAQRWVY
ncbi:MAG TPA: glutamine synthetase family protein [Pseudonocardiaceae bacterium]|nr:glutamine synthetase family protein [Pseudonocardiaceae bacterium]